MIVLTVCMASLLPLHAIQITSGKKTSPPPSTSSAAASEAAEQMAQKEKEIERETESFARELMAGMPKDAVIRSADYSGKTWVQNGLYPKPFDQVKKEIFACLRAEKYQLLHEIPLTAEQDKVLIAWQKNDVKLVLMLWKETDTTTGFSWGKTK